MSRIEPLLLLLSFLAWPALGVGMALGFSIHRPPDPDPPRWEEALRWLGVALAWGSAVVAIAAVRTLGRQWSLEARVLEGHRLIAEDRTATCATRSTRPCSACSSAPA